MPELQLQNLTDAYQGVIKEVLKGCFTDAERENVEDSAARIARGVAEMVWSTDQIVSEVKKALHTLFPVDGETTGDEQPIIVGPIDSHSLCPHHFLPIVNTVVVGYVPAGMVIGLSKLPRIVDALARRAVVQEQYTKDIGVALTQDRIGDFGLGTGHILCESVAVNVRAVHHCMVCRGVKGRALTETEYLTGQFLDNGRAYAMFTRFLTKV